MTWVIGASSVFGVGLLVSDVRVSLRNGQRRDMLGARVGVPASLATDGAELQAG